MQAGVPAYARYGSDRKEKIRMTVSTKYGKIEGIEQGNCVVYKGVPYAKPPVGPLRFHKPKPPKPWEGVYRADHYRCKSMQSKNPRDMFYKKEFYSNPEFEVPMSEDCLYLNIWVPKGGASVGSAGQPGNGACPNGKLPVAVYVHGGAFLGGAGSNLPFVCDGLASAGVIVVTINYRLGAFGFLCHPLLAVEGENEAGGNYGLWDQIAALHWVQENIGAFGGDASNVTVFGQSAGAMSLQVLAVSPRAKGLFHRMILQSGGGYQNPLAQYRDIGTAAGFAEDLLAALGVSEWKQSGAARQKALAALYETPAEEMMRAMEEAIGRAFAQKKGMPYVPVIDGELLPEDGNRLIETGAYHPVPYLIGANGDDITAAENGERSPKTNPLHRGDVAFAQIVNQNPDAKAYVYYFDRKLPGDESGAFHSAELWYVFGSLRYCWRPMEDADYALSRRMITYWSNFMKTGDPNGEGSREWRVCTEEDPYYMTLR